MMTFWAEANSLRKRSALAYSLRILLSNSNWKFDHTHILSSLSFSPPDIPSLDCVGLYNYLVY